MRLCVPIVFFAVPQVVKRNDVMNRTWAAAPAETITGAAIGTGTGAAAGDENGVCLLLPAILPPLSPPYSVAERNTFAVKATHIVASLRRHQPHLCP